MIPRRHALKRTPQPRNAKPPKRSRIKPKPRKNPMPPGRREEIFERDGFACRLCAMALTAGPGQPDSGHVHHIKKLSHGGGHEPANLLLLCNFDHLIRVHHQGARKDFVWIVGDANGFSLVNENPKGRL